MNLHWVGFTPDGYKAHAIFPDTITPPALRPRRMALAAAVLRLEWLGDHHKGENNRL